MIPLRYNVRSLLVRRTTTLATVIGIGLVVAVLASSMMLTEGIRKTMASSGTPGHAIVLRKGSDVEMTSSIELPSIGLVLAAPGVKKDSGGRPIGAGEIVTVIALPKLDASPGAVSNVTVRGVADNVLALRPEVHFVAGRPARPGSDEAVIGARIAGRFEGMALGKSFELKKNRPLTVVGVFETNGSSFESEAWADVETVRTSFGRDGVTSVTVALDSPAAFYGFEAAVEHDQRLGLEAMTEPSYYEKQSGQTATFISIVGWIISVFFMVAAMIGAFITMNTAVAHRQREIGTMRALGFSRFAVLTSFVLEGLVLALSGAALGLLVAFGVSFAKFSMMNFATWSEIVFSFTMTPRILVTSVIVGGITGLIGGIIPAARAARLKPIDALRS
jgi:putative ABC transport system permease protein